MNNINEYTVNIYDVNSKGKETRIFKYQIRGFGFTPKEASDMAFNTMKFMEPAKKGHHVMFNLYGFVDGKFGKIDMTTGKLID